MKRIESEEEDDLRPEYDFSQMKGGVRGKYVERYREGTNVVLLDPDVAAAFPDAKAVNDALRLFIAPGKGWALVTEPGAVATGSKIQLECKHPVATAPGSVTWARLIVVLGEWTEIRVCAAA